MKLLLTFVGLVVFSTPAYTATVFSQTPDFFSSGGIASDVDFPINQGSLGVVTLPMITYDDFVLAASATVMSVSWQGHHLNDDTILATDSFTVSIYSDIASEPGALLDTFFVGNDVNRVATGLVGNVGNDIYEYSANLGAGVSLSAGTTYWISIYNDTTGDPDGPWYWNSGNGGLGNSVRSWGGGPWVDNVQDQHFALSNSSIVPIPAAVWLFGSALAGLGWFRRKTA